MDLFLQMQIDFPAIHKVGNVGISVLLKFDKLRQINYFKN